MNAKEIKIYLSQDVNRVEKLLRQFGFHTFSYRQSDDNLRCALPNGDNPTSLSLYVNEFLGGTVYTRSGVNGDIFTIIEEVTESTVSETLSVTRKLFGLPGYKKAEQVKSNFATDYVNKYVNRGSKNTKRNKLFDDSYLNRFVRLPHVEIIQEGISFDTADLFNICYDAKEGRAIFPHYDWIETDKIAGIQGRIVGVTAEEVKQLRIPKYWNYIQGYMKSSNLYGWHIAKEFIEREKKLILFESEKSVLKHFTMNKNEGFSVALGGHELSDEQIGFIAKNTPIDTEIIVAFDKDIMVRNFDIILDTCERISQFRKVSFIFDEIDNGRLLKEKDAPIDNGVKVWRYFYSNRFLYEKGEKEYWQDYQKKIHSA